MSLTATGLDMPAVDHLSNNRALNVLLDRAISGLPSGLTRSDDGCPVHELPEAHRQGSPRIQRCSGRVAALECIRLSHLWIEPLAASPSWLWPARRSWRKSKLAILSVTLHHHPQGQRCICIERDTEEVLQCQVLRCQEQARRNFVIDQGQGGLSETMVCEAHAAALKAGERYVYNSVENVIYMGQDAPPQGK
jgi:hypothetical protein